MYLLDLPERVATATWRRFPALAQSERLYAALLAGSLLFIALAFHDSVGRFHESPFDGVFQTLFPLRRMDAGEMPGRDFFYFHGNGIPYLLYPIYWLLNLITGKSLLASLWATFLINVLCLYLPIYLFFWQQYGRKWAYAAIVIVSFLNEFFFLFGFYNSPLFIGAPMGVRMAPHLFALVVLNWRGKTGKAPEITLRRALLLGVLSGIAPFFGAEQGVYATAGIGGALFLVGAGWRDRLLNTLSFAGVALAVFVLGQLAAFGNLETIRAMKIIADNQVWVYGVYPNTFFAHFSDVFSFAKTVAIPSQLTTLATTAVMGYLTFLWLKARTVSPPLFASLLAMYIGGLCSWASNIGYVGHHQSAIFMKLLLIVLCAGLIKHARRYAEGAGR